MLLTIPPLSVKVNSTDIRTIMDVMKDLNPIHVDEELALSLGLRGCVNQGPANLGYVINMIIKWVGNPEAIRNLKIRFYSISCPGDQLEARGIVTELISVADKNFAQCSIELVRVLDNRKEDVEKILSGTASVEITNEFRKRIDQSDAK